MWSSEVANPQPDRDLPGHAAKSRFWSSLAKLLRIGPPYSRPFYVCHGPHNRTDVDSLCRCGAFFSWAQVLPLTATAPRMPGRLKGVTNALEDEIFHRPVDLGVGARCHIYPAICPGEPEPALRLPRPNLTADMQIPISVGPSCSYAKKLQAGDSTITIVGGAEIKLLDAIGTKILRARGNQIGPGTLVSRTAQCSHVALGPRVLVNSNVVLSDAVVGRFTYFQRPKILYRHITLGIFNLYTL